MSLRYLDKKAVVEDCLKLSIFDLKNWGYLITRYSGNIQWLQNGAVKHTVGVRFEPLNSGTRMRLVYSQTNYAGVKQRFDYTVEITTTPCNYGYERYWFICPLVKNGIRCGRRVGVLYKGSNYFGCRHCFNLSYSSRNESKTFRQYPWRVLTDDDKREKLKKRMKRTHYAGRPTKLFQRIQALDYAGV